MKFVSETCTPWERLEQAGSAGQPIVLYGTGDGADKIVDFCQSKNISIAAIFASDGFRQGKIFRGIKVESYDSVRQRLGDDFLLIIAFASELPEVLNRFQELSHRHETLAPHLGLFCRENADQAWLTQHAAELNQAYDLLADDLSRQVFQDLLNYKFSGKLHYLFDHCTRRRDDLALLQLGGEECYFDLGAYNGDTIQEFLETTTGRYSHIVAVEADTKNYQKLCSAYNSEHIQMIQAAIWEQAGSILFASQSGRAAHVELSGVTNSKSKLIPATTIDELSKYTPYPPTYIKMDLEGCEKQALQGAAATLAKYKSKLLLAGYHYNDDLFAIPLLLHRLQPEYRIYLRKHPYLPDWEINFFCI